MLRLTATFVNSCKLLRMISFTREVGHSLHYRSWELWARSKPSLHTVPMFVHGT